MLQENGILGGRALGSWLGWDCWS